MMADPSTNKRPAFQFYPGDWLRNSKLRRCSHAARGAWVDVLCLLHDAEQYGVLDWPLSDIAQAAGAPIDLLLELATKGVIKGSDSGCEGYVYQATHAGTKGPKEVVLPPTSTPRWYCSRFVRDEHIRKNRGKETRFSDTNPPPNKKPTHSPNHRVGDGEGDGASTAVASASAFALSSADTPPSGEKHTPPSGDGSVPDRRAANGDPEPPAGKPERRKTITAAQLVSEHGVSPKAAADFLTARSKKRLPLTETALDGLIREYAKANLTVAEGILKCAENGWAGFKPSWLTSEAATTPRSPPARRATPATGLRTGYDRTDLGGFSDGSDLLEPR